MQQFLAIVNPENIYRNFRTELEQVLDLPDLTGVDLRWSLGGETGGVKRNIDALNIARLCRDRGKELRMHGWLGAQHISEGVAQDQARQFARICSGEGVNAFGANAEKEVWMHGQDAAVAFLNTFLDTFYETGRRTHCAYLGFIYPPLFYGRDTQIPDELKKRFWQAWQMIYQLTADAVHDKIELGKREWPNHARNAYIGPGRIDANGTVQGAWPVWLTHAKRMDAITWYVGNGRAGEQLAGGNPKHPPLTIAIPRLAHP